MSYFSKNKKLLRIILDQKVGTNFFYKKWVYFPSGASYYNMQVVSRKCVVMGTLLEILRSLQPFGTAERLSHVEHPHTVAMCGCQSNIITLCMDSYTLSISNSVAKPSVWDFGQNLKHFSVIFNWARLGKWVIEIQLKK